MFNGIENHIDIHVLANGWPGTLGCWSLRLRGLTLAVLHPYLSPCILIKVGMITVFLLGISVYTRLFKNCENLPGHCGERWKFEVIPDSRTFSVLAGQVPPEGHTPRPDRPNAEQEGGGQAMSEPHEQVSGR